jgi:hypothetical protein
MMKILNKIWSAGLPVLLLIAAPLKNPAQDNRKDTAQSAVIRKPDQKTDDALKQKAEQIKNEQKAVRQQRWQGWIREGQEQSVGKPISPPPIYGQTPLQQQQMALRDQKRQLRWQQEQAQRAKQAQQLKFEKRQAGKP